MGGSGAVNVSGGGGGGTSAAQTHQGLAAPWGSVGMGSGSGVAPVSNGANQFFGSGSAGFGGGSTQQGGASTSMHSQHQPFRSSRSTTPGLYNGMNTSSGEAAFGALGSRESPPPPSFAAFATQYQQPQQPSQGAPVLNPSEFPSLSPSSGQQQDQMTTSTAQQPQQWSPQRTFPSSSAFGNIAAVDSSASSLADQKQVVGSAVAGGIFGFTPSDAVRSNNMLQQHVLPQQQQRNATTEFNASTEDFPALGGAGGGGGGAGAAGGGRSERRGPEQVGGSTAGGGQEPKMWSESLQTNLGAFFNDSTDGRKGGPAGSGVSTATAPSSFVSGDSGDVSGGMFNLNGKTGGSAHSAFDSQSTVPPRPASTTPMTMMDAFGVPSERPSSVGAEQRAPGAPGVIGRGGPAVSNGSSGSSGGVDSSFENQLYGMHGLLRIMKPTSERESVHSSLLSLGVDLTMLGLNLNSADPLYASLDSVFSSLASGSDEQYGGSNREPPPFTSPKSYVQIAPPQLQSAHFARFGVETLFYMFYCFPRDRFQLYAALELYARKWLYHRELKVWFARLPGTTGGGSAGSAVGSGTGAGGGGAIGSQREVQQNGAAGAGGGSFLYFDVSSWERRPFHENDSANSLEADPNFASGFLSENEIRSCLTRAG